MADTEGGNGLSEIRNAVPAMFDGEVMVEDFLTIATAIEAETGERVWAIRTDPTGSAFTVMALSALAKAYLDEQISLLLGYHDDGDDDER